MDIDDFMGRFGLDARERQEPAHPISITTTVVDGSTVFEVEYSDGTKVVVSREQAFYAAAAIHARGLVGRAGVAAPATPAPEAQPGISPKMIRNPNAKPPSFLKSASSMPMQPPAPEAPRANRDPVPRSPERRIDPVAPRIAPDAVDAGPAHGAARPDDRQAADTDAHRMNRGAPAGAPGALATLVNRTFDAGGTVGRSARRGAGVAAAKIAPLAGAAAVAGYRSAKNLIASGGVAPGDPYERVEPTMESLMPEQAQTAPAAPDVADDASDTSGHRPMMVAFFRSVAEYEQSVADLYLAATGRDERSINVPLAPSANDDFHLDGIVRLKPRSEPARPGAGTGYGAKQPTFAEALAGMPHAHEHIERCDDCIARISDRADMAIREMAGYDDSDTVRETQKKAMQDAIERANQRVRALFDGRDDNPLAEQGKAQLSMIDRLFDFLSSIKAKPDNTQDQDGGPR